MRTVGRQNTGTHSHSHNYFTHQGIEKTLPVNDMKTLPVNTRICCPLGPGVNKKSPRHRFRVNMSTAFRSQLASYLLFLLSVRSSLCTTVSCSPSFSRHLARDSERSERDREEQTFAVVTALNADGATLCDRLFGVCLGRALPTAGMGSRIQADLCAPLAPDAPALLLLGASSSNAHLALTPPASLATLAVADVWLAALPALAGGAQRTAALDAVLERALDAVEQMPPSTTDGATDPPPPRRLLLVISTTEAATKADELLSQPWSAAEIESRLDELRALRPARSYAHVRSRDRLVVSVASLSESGGGGGGGGDQGGSALLARFARPARPDYLLGDPRRVPKSLTLAQVPCLLSELLWVLDAPKSTRRATVRGGGGSTGGRDERGEPGNPSSSSSSATDASVSDEEVLQMLVRVAPVAIKPIGADQIGAIKPIGADQIGPIDWSHSPGRLRSLLMEGGWPAISERRIRTLKSLSAKGANPSSCSSSSLRRGGRVAGEASGGGAEAEPPRTAEQLARLASAAPSEWLALVGCEGARQKACEAAAAEARELRTAIAEAARNPLDDFAPRAERLIANTLRVYDASSSRFVSRRSHAAKREAVSRAATAEALRLTRQQLSVLLEDALATFRAELVLLMAASARYDRASTRLSRKTTRRFERAVRAAMPAPIGARPQGVALQRRSVRRLRQRLLIEAAAHEAEAAALPPREQDVGPSPWWKQLLVQAIQIVLNLAQGYLLQYLPAKRKDLADERAMPRGPLF